MPVTNYYTDANGQIYAEATNGVRTDYLTDPLGSVIGTMNAAGQLVNTYRYKPYGGLLAKTGNGADPSFMWVGSLGYRQTGKKWSDVYVRARHYETQTGRWGSPDPLLRPKGTHGYAGASPALRVDPSGLFPTFGDRGNGCSDAQQGNIRRCCYDFLFPYLSVPGFGNTVAQCVHALLPGTADRDIRSGLDLMAHMCTPGNARTCVWCLPSIDGDAATELGWPKGCKNKCVEKRTGMFTRIPLPHDPDDRDPFDPEHLPPGCNVYFDWPRPCDPLQTDKGGTCDCVVAICPDRWPPAGEGFCPGFMHELLHCGRIEHLSGVDLKDFFYAMGCCVCQATRGKWPRNCGSQCGPFGVGAPS